ncbi:MAG: lipid-A-disaccharide synthase [Deltaproteobacteria bacterium]|nr:lipid-A-disaccharide synthase [Deltaproteobacteria bacterium]
MKNRILIVAGEASGDKHGAKLVREIKLSAPETHLYGIGGTAMRAEGVDTFIDSGNLAVIGLWEVVHKIGMVWKAFQRIRHEFLTHPPDLVILIDFPDFNLRVAHMASKRGIPVAYYISPQVWAWRKGRVKQIARWVRKMLVIFPFEATFYKRHGIRAEYVGHPLLDEPMERMEREEALRFLNLDPNHRYVGLLPGSRRSEIRLMFPNILRAGALIHRKFPDTRFIVPVASTLKETDLAPYLKRFPIPVSLVTGRFQAAMRSMDAAIVASGSATLETAMLDVPMCIVYRVSPITALVGRFVINVDYIGIINLIAGRQVAVELIQNKATPQRMAREIEFLLNDPERCNRMRADYREIRVKLGDSGASPKAARHILEILQAGAAA